MRDVIKHRTMSLIYYVQRNREEKIKERIFFIQIFMYLSMKLVISNTVQLVFYVQEKKTAIKNCSECLLLESYIKIACYLKLCYVYIE